MYRNIYESLSMMWEEFTKIAVILKVFFLSDKLKADILLKLKNFQKIVWIYVHFSVALVAGMAKI